MITLNLISEQHKNDNKLKHLHQSIKKIDYIVIIFICLISILLLASKLFLQDTFEKTVAATTLITKNGQGYTYKVGEINTKISSLEKVQSEFLVWSKLLKDLNISTPESINFNYIKTGLDKNIIIRGRADTRDDLLLFKQNLEKSSYFEKINLPLSSILEKENISFEINAKIKPELLKL